MWDDQVAELKKSFRVLRYDQRGHGGTEVTEGKYSFDILAADVIGLFDALAIERAHFAGISMGGMTALFLAERDADRFDRIMACDCGPASTPASAQQWKEPICPALKAIRQHCTIALRTRRYVLKLRWLSSNQG